MLGIVLAGIGVGALVGIIAALVSLGRAGNKKRLEEGSANRGNSAPPLTPEQQDKLRTARQCITDAKMQAHRIDSDDVSSAALAAAAKAEGLVSALREQPEEIRRAKQLFSYYLPTLGVVLQKYRTLEENGMAGETHAKETVRYLADMGDAFDKIRENMFKDEELDLTVEIEAMQSALERDGLR